MKKFTILFLSIAFIISCSYDFSSDNFIDLEEPIKDAQYIELVNFKNQDTINVQRTLKYNFEGLQSQITIKSEVYIDNQRINSDWDGRSGNFTLTPENYEDGTRNIRIEHTFSAGSGSIADQSGLETITEIAIYQFVVNREPSTPPNILSVDISDGTIMIEWSTDYEMDYVNAYLNLQFKTREIKIPLSDEELAMGLYNDRLTVLYQGDSNTPNFEEYSMVSYSILFESEFENTYGYAESVSYDPSSVRIEIIFNDFDSYKYKWSAHPMYANFENFEFSYLGGTFLGSSQGGEYLVETPYVFGREYSFNGRPSETNLPLSNYSYRNVSLDSETFGEFQLEYLFVREILFNPVTNHFYALIIESRSSNGYGFSIYEYSAEMEFLGKSSLIDYANVRYEYLDMTINPDDNNIHVDARGSAYEIEINTLEILEEFKDPPLTSELFYRGDILARLDYTSDQLTIRNVQTNTVLYSAVSPSSRLGYLSPDGNYIFIYSETGNYLYRIDGNQLIQVFDFFGINWAGGIEIFEDTLFYSINNQIVIYDLITNTSKSFSFGSTQQTIQFDNLTQQLLVSQNGQNAIYNIVSEEIIRFQSEDNKRASGTFNQVDRGYFMRQWNNRLIHSRGIYLDIN